MKRNYVQVRKVSWDQLWHAVFFNAAGQESWDRVSETEALRLSKLLAYR